ncbi:MAG TPA: GNAT family N-acetyltransferase [Acidimicrobiales bacterium]
MTVGNEDEAMDEAALAHRNLIAYSRVITRWSSKGALGGDEGEDGNVLLYAGGSWIPVIGNGAFRLRDDVASDDLIARADAFFADLGRGYSIKVRDNGADADLPSVCAERGLAAFGDPVPEMICRRRLDDPVPPAGVVLREVTDDRGVADFIAVNGDAYATYGMPPDVLVDLFDRPGPLLADEDTIVVVAYRDEQPVAAALTYLSDGVAGLQWVGTVAAVRQMGLGRTVTEWATNVAFDRGATCCTLQASPMGEPIYARLGYETLYHYREWVRWSAPTA